MKLTGSKLAPVLDSLARIVHESKAWLEITTLLIPGHNDSDAEIEAECRWIRRELGAHVPLHFSAFHPDFKMTDIEATPSATLTRARRIAQRAGLRYVFTGNVHDRDGGTTYCPGCQVGVIVRDWYRILDYRLSDDGHCPDCGTAVAGRFQHFDVARQFGPRRIPVRLKAGAL